MVEVYLSKLTLSVQQRSTWRLLGDTYALHRFILQGFPEVSEGGCGRVLFRVDSGKGEAQLLVQSDKEPNWFKLPREVVTDIQGPKRWVLQSSEGQLAFQVGQRLRFRLRANPTYKKEGKRHAWLLRSQQADWLARKGIQHGFSLSLIPSGEDWLNPFGEEDNESKYDVRIVPLDHLRGNKPSHEKSIEHFGVDFEGVLTVTDPVLFAEALAAGIGAAKGFGFGLLSVARA